MPHRGELVEKQTHLTQIGLAKEDVLAIDYFENIKDYFKSK